MSGSTGEAGSPSTMVEGASSKSVVDVFLVCVAIGGKEAKKMACLPQHRHMKLIPWGGVRAYFLFYNRAGVLVVWFVPRPGELAHNYVFSVHGTAD